MRPRKKPLYSNLVERLKRDVEAGKWGPAGSPVRARGIAKAEGVSRDTVNKAFAELLALGYIERKGTRRFVVCERNRPAHGQCVGIVPAFSRLPDKGFYFEIVSAVEACGRERNLLAAWMPPVSAREKDASYLEQLHTDGRVAGYVFLGVENAPVINGLAEKGIPVVSVDYAAPALRCDAVVLDDDAGCRAAVDLLWRCGRRRFHVVTLDEREDYPSRERARGYLAALRERNVDASRVNHSRIGEGDLRKTYRSIIDQAGAPTAFLTAYDWHARGLQRVAIAAGRRVPEDVAFATFGEPEANAVVEPPVPCIRTENRFLGEQAFACLMERIEREGGIPGHRKIFADVRMAHAYAAMGGEEFSSCG